MPPLNPEQENQQPPRVSAIVVSHNRLALLRRCLESIENSEGREKVQLIVVDNGSRDGSAQLEPDFPNAQFIKLPKNFGLTKAMNLGWRAANADYILFLHDDVELESQTIVRLADALDTHADASGVCPLLLDAEGRPAPQLGDLPPDGRYEPAELSGEDPVEVDYPRGAALMVRAFVIKATRQIDERYGQFGCDADLCMQILRGSKKILLVPGARARHHGGAVTAVPRGEVEVGRAAFLGKYVGHGAALKARIGSALGALVSFRLGEMSDIISGRKIDGSQ